MCVCVLKVSIRTIDCNYIWRRRITKKTHKPTHTHVNQSISINIQCGKTHKNDIDVKRDTRAIKYLRFIQNISRKNCSLTYEALTAMNSEHYKGAFRCMWSVWNENNEQSENRSNICLWMCEFWCMNHWF